MIQHRNLILLNQSSFLRIVHQTHLNTQSPPSLRLFLHPRNGILSVFEHLNFLMGFTEREVFRFQVPQASTVDWQRPQVQSVQGEAQDVYQCEGVQKITDVQSYGELLLIGESTATLRLYDPAAKQTKKEFSLTTLTQPNNFTFRLFSHSKILANVADKLYIADCETSASKSLSVNGLESFSPVVSMQVQELKALIVHRDYISVWNLQPVQIQAVLEVPFWPTSGLIYKGKYIVGGQDMRVMVFDRGLKGREVSGRKRRVVRRMVGGPKGVMAECEQGRVLVLQQIQQ